MELDRSCAIPAEEVDSIECLKSIPFRSSKAGLLSCFSRRGLGSGGVVPKSSSKSPCGSTLTGLLSALGAEDILSDEAGCRALGILPVAREFTVASRSSLSAGDLGCLKLITPESLVLSFCAGGSVD